VQVLQDLFYVLLHVLFYLWSLLKFRISLKPNAHRWRRRRRSDSADELSRVGVVNAPVGSRDPIYNFLCCWATGVVTSDDIMTSLLIKKLSISIKIHVLKPLWSLFCQFPNVDRIRQQSSWASCEFCSHCRRDATRQLSHVSVGGVNWASASCPTTTPHRRWLLTQFRTRLYHLASWHCSGLYARCNASVLQRVTRRMQNCAVRYILNAPQRSPPLRQLHWLPIESRMCYKLCSLMYRVNRNIAQTYLSELCVNYTVLYRQQGETRPRIRRRSPSSSSSSIA